MNMEITEMHIEAASNVGDNRMIHASRCKSVMQVSHVCMIRSHCTVNAAEISPSSHPKWCLRHCTEKRVAFDAVGAGQEVLLAHYS